MPEFIHVRTGRTITVGEGIAARYRRDPRRWQEALDVPEGSVAEVLAWAGDDLARRGAALAAERAGKNRKGIIDALG